VPTSRISAACKKSCTCLLEGLDAAAVNNVLSAATERRFAAKSVIVNQGDPANHLYLLAKGRARLSFTTQEGKEISLVWLAPGEILGGLSLLSKPSYYLVTTEAVEASTALVWDRPTIRRLAKAYPQILENALLTASEYLAWYCAAHAAVVTETAQQRLSQAIVCLAHVLGREVSGGVELDVTNEMLASAAHITPFTASRLLGKWQRGGVIEKRRGKIVLRSLESLFSPKFDTRSLPVRQVMASLR
jgi:CRP-like cAMP-binding protein